MSCVRPLEAFRGPGGSVVFDRVKSLSKIPFNLPCGRCIGCRLERARQWGLRCLHEAKLARSSCFLTLTYNDDYLPDGNTLMKRDLQLFCKKLHNRLLRKRGFGIRYFAAGEYGDANLRPHYHLLIFGYDFPDKRFHAKNKRGEDIFTSMELRDLWFQGFNTIGPVTMDSAVYCAKYALKKVNGEKADAHYEMVTADGVVYSRQPEFALMSRRPGIASAYYEAYGNEVRALDNVVVDARKVRPPRFYDQKSDVVDPPTEGLLDKSSRGFVKRKRKALAVMNAADNTPERLRVKEALLEAAVKKKERNL